MKKYIDNLNLYYNCDSILKQISQHTVEPSHGHMELEESNPYYQDYINQTKMLADVGYDSSTVEYRHYQTNKHFSEDVANVFGKIVNATPLLCWISEIRPGKCTPWHWDINPWEEEHKKKGQIVRYFCFISKPAPGHVFVVGQDAYYYEEQGAIYQYPDIHAWHAGTNIGLESKFLLTFTGYQ